MAFGIENLAIRPTDHQQQTLFTDSSLAQSAQLHTTMSPTVALSSRMPLPYLTNLLLVDLVFRHEQRRLEKPLDDGNVPAQGTLAPKSLLAIFIHVPYR